MNLIQMHKFLIVLLYEARNESLSLLTFITTRIAALSRQRNGTTFVALYAKQNEQKISSKIESPA
jgi:hypothetical protein